MSPKTTLAKNDIWTDALYGVINAIIILPVTISFTSIIFRDTIFSDYLPILIKLVLFSSVIHQLIFSLLSSLPFSVGQVQDAGLIFLSAMATSIVSAETKKGHIERAIPTTLVALSLATFLLGIVIVLVGRFKLASTLQYLPMPVIGGYLAFIGFFCGQAGIAMMTGEQLITIDDWWQIFNIEDMIHLSPGLLVGAMMYSAVHYMPGPTTLPMIMVIGLSVFYMILWLSSSSLQSARDAGWIMELSQPVPIYSIWELFDWNLIDWAELPRLIIQWFGLCFIVAFSSTLDVAAIEMENGLPLDYDRELTMVGISNIMSGLTGGYSGSYIFSQTIFNLRRGVNSRICGFIIAFAEVIILMIPYSITGYTPICFYGALLVFIAFDLMVDWLVFAREKMPFREACICWTTFVAIQMCGIELGMVIGVALSCAEFAFSYAGKMRAQLTTTIHTFDTSYHNLSSSSTPSSSSSSSSSSMDEVSFIRSLEHKYDGTSVIISLHGYIFFGSGISTLDAIKSYLHTHGLHSSFENHIPPSSSLSASSSSSSLSSSSSMILSSLSWMMNHMNISISGSYDLLPTASYHHHTSSDVELKDHNASSSSSSIINPMMNMHGHSISSKMMISNDDASTTIIHDDDDHHSIIDDDAPVPSMILPPELKKHFFNIQPSPSSPSPSLPSPSSSPSSPSLSSSSMISSPHHRISSSLSTPSSSSSSQHRKLRDRSQQPSSHRHVSNPILDPKILISTPTHISSSSPPSSSLPSSSSSSPPTQVALIHATLESKPPPPPPPPPPPSSSSSSSTQEKRILIIDMSHVIGVDSTAAKSCFLIIVEAMRKSNIHVAYLNISRNVEELFRKQHVISDSESVYLRPS